MTEDIDLLQDGIAIIGISCRFPGAKNKDEFWKNLITQKESVKIFSEKELQDQEYDWDSLKNNPDFVNARGCLDDVDKWDAVFFNVTPKDAKVMDPQQRLWLQNTWHAFEDAGYNPYNYKGSIGVYAGSFFNTYLLNNVLRNPETYELYIRGRSPEVFQTYINNDPMFLATRTAYFYNLKGPAISMQTACSTSLVAISQACTSLLGYESDMCVAGGVTVIVPQQMGYIYQEGAIGSPDGHCKPFDMDSKGTVFGNGVGTVILKRLKDAINDNDRIYSVIRGWAVNNDGNQKVGFTAPGIEGQYSAIKTAQSFADINADEISYIEAHGTATPLGDPIEVAALTKAFRTTTNKTQFCGLGSVKSNIGHLDAAAGVAGLIKIALSAYNKKIPATLHFNKPNPRIDFQNSPFFVVDKNIDWTEDRPMIMGVSSFGVGGTNAHVLLSDFKTDKKEINSTKPGLFLLSAKSKNSLNHMQSNLCDFLANDDTSTKDDITYTLQKRRMHMPFRSFAVAFTKNAINEASFVSREYDSSLNELAFVFPGQGAQLPRMGENLYNTEPVFKSILDDCFAIYREITGADLKEIIFSKNIENSTKKLAQTHITQVALFVIEYALAKLYMFYGIRPNHLVGHSIGELTAAAISEVFDLKSAISIVCKRGELMQSMPVGNMASVISTPEILEKIKAELFEIAAINSQNTCTISFQPDKSERVYKILAENEIVYVTLKTSHAFHSKIFDPILEEFSNFVDSFHLNAPKIPFISCLTGKTITNEQATSGNYWSKQLRNTVLFSNEIEELGKFDNVIFLEVGPNTHLSGLIRHNEKINDKSLIINSLGKPSEEAEQIKFFKSIGELWMRGIEANFDLFYNNQKPNLAPVPLYEFEKNKYWIDYIPALHNNTDSNSNTRINEVSIETAEEPLNDPVDKIKQIWLDVFGIDAIKDTDDFFELGGQSLLALQIISRMKDKLNIAISLKDFLNNPTIEKIKRFTCDIPENLSNNNNAPQIDHLTELTHLPLTNTQERLWLIAKFDGDNPAYNIPFTFHLTGSLDFDVLQKTMNELYERHHIVHACFHENNNEPFYQISTNRTVFIKKYDISTLIEIDKEIELHRIIGENTRKTFDLSKGKLFRLCLIKYGSHEFYFHSTIHHIIFDGLSWGVFVRDFNSIYEDISNHKKISLSPIKFQQYDYANWIKKHGNQIDLSDSISFWKETLDGIPEYTNFPFDRPRDENKTGYGRNLQISLPASLSKKVSDFSKSMNVTPFYTMLSAFSLLIKKYSGEDDFCVGSSVSDRPHDYLENVFGMFVNTITLRFKYDDNANFKDIVEYTKRISLDAIAHQDLPFDKVVEIVNPERSLLYSPLFQIAFTWQNSLSNPIQTSTLSGKNVSVKNGVAPFDLTFYMREVDGCIEGDIEYNIDILDDESIVHIKNNFIKIIEEVIINPEMSITQLSGISDYANNTLNHYNNTSAPVPDKLLHQLFEDAVNKFPNKVAVISDNRKLTYSSLNDSANKIANYLINLDVKDQLIGVCLERSEQMLITILAILKAGASYLPLDPDFPNDRLEYMLSDSNTQVLLSTKNISAKFKNLNVKTICIDDNEWTAKFTNSHNPVLKLHKESLAYIIYTSGSTGKPKGVKVPHRSAVNVINSFIKRPGISSNGCLLAVASLSFDMSVIDMFLPISVGASVVIAKNTEVTNGMALMELIEQHDINILHSTPTTYSLLLLNNWKGKSDITAICGGEAIPNKLIESLLPKIKELWNGYGPTETTVCSSFIKITDPKALVVVGTPNDNTHIQILDKNNKRLPVGVFGEVAIGGLGVTHGYLYKEELTTQKFIRDENNNLLYKTGDRGRIRFDETLELSGRMDNQIKIRGYRIEPGEIESVINGVDGIKETVVKVQKLGELDERLIAFVHREKTATLTSDTIKNNIVSKLPNYMLPSAYVIMEEFPQTPNGKIDKKRLIYKVDDSANKQNRRNLKLTETEQAIFNIWHDILKTSDFTQGDNFFHIGGQSLLALQVISRINDKFNVSISLKDFMSNPTIEKIKLLIGENKDIENKETNLKIEHLTDLSRLPLTNTQKRLWFISKINGAKPTYNIPVTYHLTGSLDFDVFQKTIELLFERHHIIYASFHEENNEPYYQIPDNRTVFIKKYDISDLKQKEKEEHLNKIIAKNTRITFDLSDGKLFRICLIKYGTDNYYFHLTIHHIIFDGVSSGVFVRDFNIIYDCVSNNNKILLSPIKFQQYDYANWLNKRDNENDLSDSISFWKKTLKGIPEYTNFPFDNPRKENQTGFGRNIQLNLSSDLSKRVSAFSKKMDVTTFYTMCAAFSLLIRKYSGENDFCIGSPVSNRPHDFLENIFGMFVNTITLRFKYDENTSFKDLVEYTKKISLDAIEHQDLPFDKVVEIVNPKRSTMYNPLFQIVFAWQNNLSNPIQTSNLAGKKVAFKNNITPFDLSFYMWEEDGIINGDIEYNIEILEDESIDHIKNNFVKIIDEVINNPETKISELSCISDYSNKILNQYNNTSALVPDRLLHELLEDAAEKYPNNIAVISGNTKLSYSSLNQSANKLANYLIKKNVKGQTIGVSLDRSEQMLISILAILKAGACYLPLDPNFPKDRLEYILENSNAKLLISTFNNSAKFENFKINTICIDKIGWHLKFINSQNPNLKIDKESLAYMIYTSGSTGNPKGVKVPHRSAVNLINSTKKRPGINSKERFLAVTTLSFDISVLEMFLPTSVGATVVIANTNEIKNGLALMQLIEQHDITMMQSTPTTYNLLLLNGWKGKSDLTAICGGEPIPNNLIKHLLPKIKTLWNGYGPTETTVYSSFYEITNPDTLVVVGTPVDNTQIYILDKNNKKLPLGVYGEVAIGGLGVTLGYHNREDLTVEKFIYDENNNLIYKTGDWGRIRNNETLELSGRIDNQIKLRGYRIEPGEIEALINRLEGIKEVVVKVQKLDELDERLIAFVHKDKTAIITPEHIRNSIISMLPNYMLPSAYAIMDDFPRTPNGKIDKNSLIYKVEDSIHDPDYKNLKLTETELSVFRIWQKILKISDFKVNDNFFDLGGNSLLALPIVENIKNEFNVDFSLMQFFNNPTILSTSDFIKRFSPIKTNMDIINEQITTNIISGEI